MVDRARGQGMYVFGRFRLDPVRQNLTSDGSSVLLRPTVFEVLLYLVEHPDRVVDKDELLDAVWRDRTVEEANLSQAVFWLRAALREHAGPDAEKMILTVRGRGYRFTDNVTWEPSGPMSEKTEDAKTEVNKQDLVSSRETAKIKWSIALVAGSIGLVLLLCVGGLVAAFWAKPHRLGPNNMVVLADFENKAKDPIFDRTLANVLRIDLSQSPYVTVMPDKRVRDTLALMTKPNDTVLTAPLAQEVCTRTNADAVIDGDLDPLGSRYILALTATDCSGQKTLAAEKADVATREDVVPALDHLIAKMRHKLGEPIESVDRFNVPLMDQKTPSLDALKAFSEGAWLFRHGKIEAAIPLYQRAIELDPNLAGAYAYLGIAYADLSDSKKSSFYLTKAYELRDNLNERQKLQDISFYNQFVTKDFNSAIQNLKTWTQLFDRDPTSWANLANAESYIGDYSAAIKDGERAIALKPTFESAYIVLSGAYIGAGQFQQARDVCNMAFKVGVAGDLIHLRLLQAVLGLHDEAAKQREIAFAQTTQVTHLIVVLAEFLQSEGKQKAAEAVFERVSKISAGQKTVDFGHADNASSLVDLGFKDRAKAFLGPPPKAFDRNYTFALAEVGDPAQAEALIAQQVRENPADTLLNQVYAPETRAALAMRQGKPLVAIAYLQSALPYQSRNFEVPTILGAAWLAAGDGAQAATQYQTILDHLGWSPQSVQYPLAKLGLARALKLKRDFTGARRAYQAFLADWKDADTDIPVLKAAKAEYAQLGN